MRVADKAGQVASVSFVLPFWKLTAALWLMACLQAAAILIGRYDSNRESALEDKLDVESTRGKQAFLRDVLTILKSSLSQGPSNVSCTLLTILLNAGLDLLLRFAAFQPVMILLFQICIDKITDGSSSQNLKIHVLKESKFLH